MPHLHCSATVTLMVALILQPGAFAYAACGVPPQFKTAEITQTPSVPAPQWSCMSAPTNLLHTSLRNPVGCFHASRGTNKLHQGVDIALKEQANKCLWTTGKTDRDRLEIYAVANGVVAYARANTECPPTNPQCSASVDTGLGFTVIIDHENGFYSLYAHMGFSDGRNLCPHLSVSQILAGQSLKVEVGNRVNAGDVIGYMGELGGDVDLFDLPSGNAIRTSEPVMLHFELFRAPTGLKSQGAISEIDKSKNRGQHNPMYFLSQFGYEQLDPHQGWCEDPNAIPGAPTTPLLPVR
jgi:murein DD-endopeptidase MepM/ murein hydrolase activator NlpD